MAGGHDVSLGQGLYMGGGYLLLMLTENPLLDTGAKTMWAKQEIKWLGCPRRPHHQKTQEM